MTKKKAVRRKQHIFTHDEKMEAAAQLYMTGCSRKAARKLPFEIASRTIRGWAQKDPDFQDKFKRLVEDNTQEAQANYRVIIQKGLDEIVDRVEHGNKKVVAGDVSVDEDGKKVVETVEYREPMTSKDLTYTTGILIDKYNVSLGQATRITKTQTDESDLMAQFEQIYKTYGGGGVINVVPEVEDKSK